MIDRHKGKRGLRKAKEAINLIRVGSDSPQESLLRLAMVSSQVRSGVVMGIPSSNVISSS
jgi:hypothetical protein